MNISNELRDKIISDFRNQESRLLQQVEMVETDVMVWFYSGMVINFAHYDVKKKKFTRLEIEVADLDYAISNPLFPRDYEILATSTKRIYIDL